jgi:Protein of unknown function (DUF2971)
MRLYHYLAAKWALDDIRRRRLKVSKIDDMNDPYEFACVRSDDMRTQLALEKTEREVAEQYGVLCFSRCWNDILMWSHYADKHRGICLGFDVDDERARGVEYVPDVRAEGSLMVSSRSEFPRQKGTEIVDRLLGAKYNGWFYEQEVREHVTLSERDEETGHYFVDFSERLKLKDVIAGVRFPMTRKPIDDALKGYAEEVRIVKARRSPTRFQIVVDESG